MIAAVRGVNYLVLVTEPTPFGLHGLCLAVEMARALGLRFGVVVNQAGTGDKGVASYCQRESIPLLAEFPFDRRVAEAYSRGEIASSVLPDHGSRFRDLFEQVMLEVAK